jgi:hypothetical protein
MATWISLTIIFTVLIVVLSILFWLDWKYKCWKTIKENKLSFYLNGYSVFPNEDVGTLAILSGVLGVNVKDIVFENRFKDESLKLIKSISDVQSFELYAYDESDYLCLIRDNFEKHEGKIRYILVNMAGYSISNKMNKIPNLLKSRKLCRIKFSNDIALLFFYKNNQKNNEAIQMIDQFITEHK